VHSIIAPGLGPIGPDLRTPYDNWIDYAIIAIPEKPKLDQVCAKACVELADVMLAHELVAALATRDARAPALLHGDFVSDQVLIADGAVAALLDFEHPRGGDPMWDLAYWSYNNRHPDTLRLIADGYTAGAGLSADEERRVIEHRLGLSLDWLYRSEDLSGMWGAFILHRFDEDLERLAATS
jgi:aminoglycoside phosphotransferase (APT) family kinase protein